MASQNRLVFINLPISDLAATKAFWEQLGFEFNPKFTDDTTGCMVVAEDAAYVLMHEPSKWEQFTTKPTADLSTAAAGIYALSADSREGVDELAEAALKAGGTEPRPAQDYGFMYGRSFTDLDGHHWEVTWMSPEAVEQGPGEFAESA